MTNLEQSIADLAEEQDLLNITLDYMRSDETEHHYFCFGLQWRDPADITHCRGIATAQADTIEEAVARAIVKMQTKRWGIETISDEALPGLAS